MKDLRDGFTLSSGVQIPCLGFGTWLMPASEVGLDAVKSAIAHGYRHIDTAAVYGNEHIVGQAIEESGVERSEIFITSKLWNTHRGYHNTLAAFEASLKALGTDYLDLYLVHWPANAAQHSDWEALNLETWRGMMECYRSGRAKAIGVSNFKVHHLRALMQTEILPMVNQIEFHPGFLQSESVSFCQEHNILIQAWGPLGQGRLLSEGSLQEMAKKYHKTAAQLCIRWCLQHHTLPLPKSVSPSRIEENAQVFDFEISAEDMALIDGLPKMGLSGLDPDLVEF